MKGWELYKALYRYRKFQVEAFPAECNLYCD
jgi:hypothetical protein